MKTVFSILAALLLPLAAVAAPSAVSVRLEQVNKSDNEKHTKKQTRSLKVHLTNASNQDLAGLTVRYFYFGKEVGESETIVLEKGERPASVKAHATEIVETPKVTATSTEEHYEGGGYSKSSSKQSGSFKLGKKVKASGKKLTGHGVQVVDKGEVIAESYSQESLKALVGGAKK